VHCSACGPYKSLFNSLAQQMANNLSKGEQLVGGKTLNDNVPLFRDMFEVSEHHWFVPH
jgi:hypothetical protein